MLGSTVHRVFWLDRAPFFLTIQFPAFFFAEPAISPCLGKSFLATSTHTYWQIQHSPPQIQLMADPPKQYNAAVVCTNLGNFVLALQAPKNSAGRPSRLLVGIFEAFFVAKLKH
ncbi:hypothetical protein [Roseovarius sp. THAF27]|uniref:hypothetical protein n=1 Tax=Roseovarius sp. THAF27 TaxID=2587850 RepID=UPI0012692C3B|nr:hypothetical protein [Roseovarius sp. THAF27]